MSIDVTNKIRSKKVAILGLGLENQALLDYFLRHKIAADFTVCDARVSEELGALYKKFQKFKNIYWQLGPKFNRELYKFDILFRSPGWPVSCSGIQEALGSAKTELSSPMNFFLENVPTKNIIGISGTKGKGTTATLIAAILKAARKKVYLGGNIGIAPLAFMEKIKPADFVVLELSSFQLEDLKRSPKISVLTNIYKEHLAPADPNNPNYHKSYNDYIRAKLRLGVYQGPKDYFIVNSRLRPLVAGFRKDSGRGQKIYFTPSPLPSRLVGDYNRENVGAALAVAKILKIKKATAEKTVKNFSNLEHRLELAAEINGVKYYDNSFSTTPESTILDLKSFRAPIIILAGGADKGANFKNLAKTIKQKAKFAILFEGQATPRLEKELLAVKYPKNQIKTVGSMPAAVALARAQSRPGDIVLLSTACASFGLFKNYKERGNLFKQYAKSQK
jgi:UDP-N-acetylmuramoylalanine--D-glutamate ligase